MTQCQAAGCPNEGEPHFCGRDGKFYFLCKAHILEHHGVSRAGLLDYGWTYR